MDNKKYHLNVRLKSGREFKFKCKSYTIETHKLTGDITRFEYEDGIGECPIYVNPVNIESITAYIEEV